MAIEIRHIPVLEGKIAKSFVAQAEKNERSYKGKLPRESFAAMDRMLERSKRVLKK